MSMNCNNKPEIFCGSIVNDTCVKVVTIEPEFACFLDIDGCYRQSEFNSVVGTKVCQMSSTLDTIVEGIDLSSLEGCEGITPVKQTVKQEFQNVYNILCELKTDLGLPITGIDVKCLVDPCGNPISTLGQLLQAIVDKLCDCCPNP